MALADLLWACPECRAELRLRPARGGELCPACGVRFRRGPGALIEAIRPGAPPAVAPAAAWVDRLPAAWLPEEGRGARRARVVARFAEGYRAVWRGREYIGRIERLGPPRPATLALTDAALELELELEPDGAGTHVWPLEAIAAVQPSSSTLQLRVRGGPLVALSFPDSSPRLWEELLQGALRAFYRRTGRGEIVEFQPRIAVR